MVQVLIKLWKITLDFDASDICLRKMFFVCFSFDFTPKIVKSKGKTLRNGPDV